MICFALLIIKLLKTLNIVISLNVLCIVCYVLHQANMIYIIEIQMFLRIPCVLLKCTLERTLCLYTTRGRRGTKLIVIVTVYQRIFHSISFLISFLSRSLQSAPLLSLSVSLPTLSLHPPLPRLSVSLLTLPLHPSLTRRFPCFFSLSVSF